MEDKNTWCVYMHTSPSGKVYIGITGQKPERRWRNGDGYLHKKQNGEYTQPAIAHAIIKYGWENFQHIIFAENLNKEEAEKLERLLVALWDTNNPYCGYNIKGGGLSGGPWSEESRKKISEKQMGEKNHNYGKPRSAETRKKISNALKGENHPNYGKTMSEEMRKKISVNFKGENNPMYGKHHSEEACKKIRDATKERFSNPKNHPMYGKHHSEESKKKISESKLGTPAHNKKAVYCIELDRQWDSISDAKKELKGVSHISDVINGKRDYAGHHPETGEELHWIEIFNIEEIK